jgi:predicted alpha/beta hydrolase family esterase
MLARAENSTTGRTPPEPLEVRAARSLVAMLAGISQPLAARWAALLFTRPRRRAVRAWERAVLAGAERFEVRAGGTLVRGARLGEGPAVLLVHGWGGRGAQLAAFAPPLLRAGCAVVWFDAPAHGASRGWTTTMPHVADVTAAVARAFGARAAIGHSLGAAAVALALRGGLVLDAAVLVGAPRAATSLLDTFCGTLGLRAGTREHLQRRLEDRAGVRLEDLDLARLATALRTPALVVHDGGDGEVPFEAAAAIAAAWPGSRLVQTDGLGHRRILRDPGVVEAASSFVVERLARCGCGRLATAVAHGSARCETCLLEQHLAHREERWVGAGTPSGAGVDARPGAP